MSELHPPIQIVDEVDRPIRGGTMDEVQLQGLWHRIARVMVHDRSTGKYLLQKVAPNPYYNGGLWNTTSSGHVDEGESYEETAVRETAEEMGIVLPTSGLVEADRYTTEKMKSVRDAARTYHRHNVTFLAELDTTPQLAPSDAVEEHWWVDRGELLGLDEAEVTDGLRRFIEKLKTEEV